MDLIPSSQFISRWKRAQVMIQEQNLDALCLLNQQNIYWISGTAQFGMLVLFPDADPVLLVRRNYARATKESWIKDLRETSQTADITGVMEAQLGNLAGKRIGLELGFIPATLFLKYQHLLKGAELVDIGDQMRELRMVKDQYEIERHVAGAEVAKLTQEALKAALKPGVREVDLAAEMLYTCKKNLGEHFSIYYARWFANNWFIVASGENLWVPSSFPIMAGGGFDSAIPFGATERVIQDGDMVAADFAFPFLGYHADHARTYILDTVPPHFRERYEFLMNAYESALDYLVPGEKAETVYRVMKKELEKHSIEKNFCGDGKYYQAVGHGIGLELDEPPFLIPRDETRFKEGMVISVEPKIIFPGWGAIGFEDNFVVGAKKPRKLTHTSYLEF